jgi:hypothetical protein
MPTRCDLANAIRALSMDAVRKYIWITNCEAIFRLKQQG